MKLKFKNPRFITINNHTVKCMLDFEIVGNPLSYKETSYRVVATAKCDPTLDKFDEKTGQRIAFARCKAKAYKLAMQDARTYIEALNDSVRSFNKCQKFLERSKTIVDKNNTFIKKF